VGPEKEEEKHEMVVGTRRLTACKSLLVLPKFKFKLAILVVVVVGGPLGVENVDFNERTAPPVHLRISFPQSQIDTE
jgi:hypothetical protein